jgi:hypothetical protein
MGMLIILRDYLKSCVTEFFIDMFNSRNILLQIRGQRRNDIVQPRVQRSNDKLVPSSDKCSSDAIHFNGQQNLSTTMTVRE